MQSDFISDGCGGWIRNPNMIPCPRNGADMRGNDNGN